MANYELNCPNNCTLRPENPFSREATELILEGISYAKIVVAAGVAGVKITPPIVQRHKRHIMDLSQPEEEGPALTNIQILESIIQQGAKNRKNWRPTIGDTMKAMDMWFRLTQGNPFDELLDAMAAASTGEDEMEEETNPDAVAEIDEQEDVIDSEG